MTVKKLQKKAKLRNAEYFGLQEVLDRLYAQSAEKQTLYRADGAGDRR